MSDGVVTPEKGAAYYASATIFGCNELAKRATTLSEKSFWRMLRERALEEGKKLGVEISFEHQTTLLELERAPHLRFTEQDIEAMRATVAKWDAEHPR